jgi:hypothetical protein
MRRDFGRLLLAAVPGLWVTSTRFDAAGGQGKPIEGCLKP